MVKGKLPLKFKDEITCPFCTCTFIPRLDGQEYCEYCTQHGFRVENKTDQQREVLYTDDPHAAVSGKTLASKPCKLCNIQFIPASPGTQYCSKCRTIRVQDKVDTVMKGVSDVPVPSVQ